jgi:hypothetical protein
MSEPKARTNFFHFGNFFIAPTDSLISLWVLVRLPRNLYHSFRISHAQLVMSRKSQKCILSCHLAPEALFLLNTTSEGGHLFKHAKFLGRKTYMHYKEGDVARIIIYFSIEALLTRK